MVTLKEKFSIKHIYEEGARFHVHSWSLIGSAKSFRNFTVTMCSEPFCEDNLVAIQDCLKHGVDPAKVIPSVSAKKWLQSDEGQNAISCSRSSGD